MHAEPRPGITVLNVHALEHNTGTSETSAAHVPERPQK
jgi:hypothetical protein